MNAFLAIVILLLCGALPAQLKVRPLPSPCPENSGQPCLDRGADGRVRLSWVTRRGGEATLAFSTLEKGAWSKGATIAKGGGWFVNWADVPSISADADGRLAAHWLERLGEGTYAYGVRIKTSADCGKSWSEPIWLHDDRSEQEHGFCSLHPVGDGNFRAVWLDGRALAKKPREMQLRTRIIRSDATLGPESLLDGRVCECCPTDLVRDRKGRIVVAYRDRSAADVRDIAFVTRPVSKEGAWSSPAVAAADGWERPG